jgi:predicted DNA-binding transcriptional regulator AlpA
MTRPTERPKLISAKEVALRLSVTPRTVWRWVSLGKLPRPLRLSPGCARWWETDVDRFLQELPRG